MFKSVLNKFSNLFLKKEQKKKIGLEFTYDGKVKIYSEDIFEFDFNGLWLDIDKIKNIVSNIDYLVLSHWKCCFLSCSYCVEKKTDDLNTIKHFDIMPIVEQLIDVGLVTKETQIVFSCGDATLHPEFDKLMYYLTNFGMKDIIVYTSAMRHCHSIAEAMIKNIAKVVVSLDSGCPYIYEKVKCINKYDIAVTNIKRYLEFENPSSKQVVINYVLLNGINDNKKEILDWFMFSRNLGVKKLSIDIEERWYNQIDIIPEYLKEIIVFTKELSEFNNLEIEFSPRMSNLCEKIQG